MARLLTGLSKAWRQTQRMFHFLTGLAFMFLAGVGVSVSLGAWRHHLADPSLGLFRTGLLVAFTLVLIFFCLYSFLKARSIR